jgi:hypothetical protein
MRLPETAVGPVLAFLALIVAPQCALKSSKAQLHFTYCALALQIAFCFCSATF